MFVSKLLIVDRNMWNHVMKDFKQSVVIPSDYHTPKRVTLIYTELKWLECSPVARETRVQSQFESYQRLKKWYLMQPCWTLSITRYGSRVKLSNPGKWVAPSPTPRDSSYWKGSLRVTLVYSRQLYYNKKWDMWISAKCKGTHFLFLYFFP